MPELAEGTEGSVEKNERGPHSAGGSVVAGGRAGQGRGLASWVWRDLWLWQGAASHSRTYEAGRSKAKAESSQEPPEKTPPGARAGLDRRTAEAVAGAAGPGEAGLLACAGRWEVGLGRRPRACHPGSGPERGRHSQVTDKKSQAQDGYAQGDTAGWKQKRDPPDPGFTRLAMVSSVEGRAVRTPASWCGGRRLGPPGPSPSAPPNLKLGSHSCSLQTGRSFSQQAEPEGLVMKCCTAALSLVTHTARRPSSQHRVAGHTRVPPRGTPPVHCHRPAISGQMPTPPSQMPPRWTFSGATQCWPRRL
ncbi:uncharacterized protein LOC120589142 [Pteropus medius]|uniref:uncharacterized protein LOC120589142 n=1 Tax=Pteropus vampyrus TaxID=132908 RepID=UPI00196B4958|nr:uncharacterized protein LOC120589142 [Pteropus giganteus]